METLWGVVLSFLFVLATLTAHGVTGPSTSEQKEQLEKQQKEQQEQLEKAQKDQKEELEKKQKEQKDKSEEKQKSDKKEKSGKKEKTEKETTSKQADMSPPARAPRPKSIICIKDCPDEWRLRQ